MRQRKISTSSVTSVFSSDNDWCHWCYCALPRRHLRIERLSVLPKRGFQQRKLPGKSSLLTGQQRLIVLRTWNKLSTEISTLGMNTMNRLLEKNPSVARVFNFGKISSTDLQLHPRYRQHAFWLIQAVSAMVENLDNVDLTVSDMFLEIGEKHAAIPSFKAVHFAALPSAWAYVWEDSLRDRYTAQTNRSWSRIFQYIVSQLALGCSDQLVLDSLLNVGNKASSVTGKKSAISIASITASITGAFRSMKRADSSISGNMLDNESESDSDTFGARSGSASGFNVMGGAGTGSDQKQMARQIGMQSPGAGQGEGGSNASGVGAEAIREQTTSRTSNDRARKFSIPVSDSVVEQMKSQKTPTRKISDQPTTRPDSGTGKSGLLFNISSLLGKNTDSKRQSRETQHNKAHILTQKGGAGTATRVSVDIDFFRRLEAGVSRIDSLRTMAGGSNLVHSQPGRK